MLNCSHAQISRESPSAECVFWRLKPSNNFKWNNLFINLSPISILLKRETLPPHFSIYYYCIVRDKWFLFSYMIRKTHRFSLRNDTTQITFLPTYPLAPRETPISVAKFLVFDLFVESVMVFLVKLVFFLLFSVFNFFLMLPFFFGCGGLGMELLTFSGRSEKRRLLLIFLRLVLIFRFPATAFGLGSM